MAPTDPFPTTAPVIFERAIADLERDTDKLLQSLERARVAIKGLWAAAYHEAICSRLAGYETEGRHVDGVMDLVLAWAREAEQRHSEEVARVRQPK